MAKRKRLNKNLVAFLTVMGVVLVVSVAGLIIRQASQRDPQILANNAQALELNGSRQELARAAGLFQQAYNATDQSDVSYLLSSTRCLYKLGQLGMWTENIQRAHAKAPTNVAVLEAALTGLWRLAELEGRTRWWSEWREYASALLEVEPENPFALASHAQGLWDPTEEDAVQARGAEVATQAYELAPTDPHVALVYVQHLSREHDAERRALLERNAPTYELDALLEKFFAEAGAVLSAAIAEHPAHGPLAIRQAEILQQKARDHDRADQDEQAVAAFDVGEQDLRRALTTAEDRMIRTQDRIRSAAGVIPREDWEQLTDLQIRVPDLYQALARHLYVRFATRFDALSEEQRENLRVQIVENTDRATALDPAVFDAYDLRAKTELLRAQGSDGFQEQAAAFTSSLDVYEQGRVETLPLETLRAVLNNGQRLMLVLNGFDTALRYRDLCVHFGRREEAADAIDRAEGFLADAEVNWNVHQLTHYMQGRMAAVKADRVEAVDAFQRATNAAPHALFWAGRVRKLPLEYLAELYQADGQLGEAKRCAVDALQQYRQQIGRPPPVSLVLLLADVHTRLNETQDALSLLDGYRDAYDDNRAIRAARAEVLAKMGRTAEASEIAREVVGEQGDPATLMWRARQSLESEDYDAAIAAAKAALDTGMLNARQAQAALQMALAAMDRTDRREEAHAYVVQLLDDPPHEALQGLLRTYDVVLSEDDPEQRDDKLRSLIDENPDPVARAEQYYNHYRGRGEFAKALPYLLELRELMPDNLGVVEEEFKLRIQLAQQARRAGQDTVAEEHLAALPDLIGRLSGANDNRGNDSAGGATYRGQLALLQQRAEDAIREYRAAINVLPKSAELEVDLARAYLMAGRPGEAVEALNRAVQYNPRSVDAHGLLTSTYDRLAEQAVGEERAAYTRRAEEHFEMLAQLAPNLPFVAQRRERASEDAAPVAAVAERERIRADNPDDLANLQRLAELYIRAWEYADEQDNASAQETLLSQGNAFFEDMMMAGPEQLRFDMARMAASFYTVSGQSDHGVAALEAFRDTQRGAAKVTAQLLVARFLERDGKLGGAEREYRAAQQMVREVIDNEAEQNEVDRMVGLSFIDFYQRANDPMKVVEVCRWLLDRMPSDSPVLQRIRMDLVDALLVMRRTGEAERVVNEYIERHGEDLSALGARARIAMMTNQRQAAERDLTRILEMDPENARALLARATLSMGRSDYEGARRDLMKARELLVPGARWEDQLRGMLASFHQRMGEVDLALNELRAQLEALNAAGASAAETQTVVARMVDLLVSPRPLPDGSTREPDNAQLDRAQALISEYMERYPEEPVWPRELGQLLEKLGDRAQEAGNQDDASRRYAAAARYYQRAADLATNDPGLRVACLAARISMLTRAEAPQEALDVFTNLPLERPTPSIRMAGAEAYWALGRREQAIEQWGRALFDASFASTSLVGAVAAQLRETLQPGDAEKLLQRVAESTNIETPAGQRSRIALAEHVLRFGRPDEARDILEEVLPKTAAQSAERLAALLALGQTHERKGNSEEAIDAYKRVLEIRDDHMYALNNVAYLLVESEGPAFPRPAEAVQYAEQLERLLQEDRNVANILDTIGWVYYRYAMSGNETEEYLDRALATLEHAYRLEPRGNPAILEHLGQVYAERGRSADARRLYRQGLALAEQTADEGRRQRFNELMQSLP